MRKILILLFVLSTTQLWAQDYFQQEVHYKIDVKLNDKNHTLSGYEEFEYINKSNQALDKIYIHLWPNAYADRKTALGKQLWSQGNSVLEFAGEEDKGYIDSLAFKVDGQDVKWEFDSENGDIAVIHLNSVLQVGKSVKVSTPFFVKIPSGDISRLGHVGESYQITQWYPKPAVIDKNGWHDMPYLTQGEFYSEYGSYDVSITVPKNYVIGATGDLQTQSEIEFMDEKAEEAKTKFAEGKYTAHIMTSWGETDFPPSDEEMKTVRYIQKDIHDFAWFADKRFQVLKGEVELERSGNKVTSWAMFVPHHATLWENSIEYLNDAITYYSKWNGDYPYKQVTAVDGTISAGGGMEYPNVTVIGNASSAIELEIVIVHEVGHNWFYGLLGSNERDHAWMDEGLNTLNEIRYMETKYPNNHNMSDMFGMMAERVHMDRLSHRDMNDYSYAMMASYGIDQPIELSSGDYKPFNYGAIVYSKTGISFTYMRDYLGDEKFDEIMQSYYNKWHFKHPQPEDLRKEFEDGTGKDLSWFFDDVIQTTKQIDYRLCSVKPIIKTGTQVKVKNVGQVNGPIRIDGIKGGKVVESQWADSGEKKQIIRLEGNNFDYVILDYDKRTPEVNRNNNSWKNKGFKKMEKLKFEFLGGDNERDRTEVWFTPIMGGNAYDKYMVGFLFHNQSIPKNKFQYTLAPMFSVGRLNVAGFADINYSWVPAKNFRTVSLGVLGKTFGNGLGADPDPTDSKVEPLGTYYLVSPYLKFDIGKPIHNSAVNQELVLRGNYVFESATLWDNMTYGGTGMYNFRYKKPMITVGANIRLDYYNITSGPGAGSLSNSDLLNGSAELSTDLTYWKQKGKKIEIRLFYGQNLMYNSDGFGPNSRYGFSLSGQNGTQDAFYESYLMGRNQMTGFWSNQHIENQGGFKSTSNLVTSTESVFAANFVFNLPFLPLCLYADYGMFEVAGSMQTAYDVGAGLRFGKIFGVYFPFTESTNMFSAGTKYGEKIRFTLTMEGLDPATLIKRNL